MRIYLDAQSINTHIRMYVEIDICTSLIRYEMQFKKKLNTYIHTYIHINMYLRLFVINV